MARLPGRKIPIPRSVLGWTVFILECANKSFYAGMTRNIKKTILKINVLREDTYFSRRPDSVPVKSVFVEKNLNFREAYAKCLYLKQMNRRQRLKLIQSKTWPIGGAYLKYIQSTPIENME